MFNYWLFLGEQSLLRDRLQRRRNERHAQAKRVRDTDRKTAADLACDTSREDDIENRRCYYPCRVLIVFFAFLLALLFLTFEQTGTVLSCL